MNKDTDRIHTTDDASLHDRKGSTIRKRSRPDSTKLYGFLSPSFLSTFPLPLSLSLGFYFSTDKNVIFSFFFFFALSPSFSSPLREIRQLAFNFLFLLLALLVRAHKWGFWPFAWREQLLPVLTFTSLPVAALPVLKIFWFFSRVSVCSTLLHAVNCHPFQRTRECQQSRT